MMKQVVPRPQRPFQTSGNRKDDTEPAEKFDNVVLEEQDDSRGACLVGDLLMQEFSGFNLAPTSCTSKEAQRTDFPFNKHTVTIGVGNAVIDFEQTRQDHANIKREQQKFARKIENVKKMMEKVRVKEQSWFTDYIDSKYVRDLTYEEIMANGHAGDQSILNHAYDPEADHDDEEEDIEKKESDEADIITNTQVSNSVLKPFKATKLTSLTDVEI